MENRSGLGYCRHVKATLTLSNRIAGYPIEARAVIRFLIDGEAFGVAQRLNLTLEEARENVAERTLDFLAGIQAKLPKQEAR